VARFDHFCGWLNNAVGEQNYKWFLLFLAVHCFMLSYATYILGAILGHQVLASAAQPVAADIVSSLSSNLSAA
jgi:hypothetical protein